MAKTLVLNGANFSENKIETVVLHEAVPCTGITLSEATKAVTSMVPFTLVATVAPADTTDALIWTTSDPNVVTVSGGVVTPVGLGVATITATCGSQSAVCSVTVDNVVPDFIVLSRYNPNKRTSDGNAMTVDKGSSGSTGIIAANQATGLYPIESKTDVDTSPYRLVPILIPSGATKIIINNTDTTAVARFKTRTYFFNSNLEETTFNTGGAYCVYGARDTYDQDSTQVGPITIPIPDNIEGLDSCCFAIGVTPSNATEIELTNAFNFVFSYGE